MNNIVNLTEWRISRENNQQNQETKLEFLDWLKLNLVQEDYEDVLIGILDKSAYQTLDDVAQTFVDAYYQTLD
jgi:hypothetical protein